ncbi:hypothetical protein E3P92_02536 [Wallemia ichthyophaga]|nr:hypothetical protein E3P91_03687 [Wallemia ichthyophaga]TIB12466.1 hypothetical protein E3P92_02536 [Wallemia ichthyophaga]TIB62614.1 hypothetical protein E3P78_02307 [Wallemia ichthyophaga]
MVDSGRGDGDRQRYVENGGTITKATPVQLKRSISTQQSTLRQRQDQLAKEKESKKAVLLDTPPATGRNGKGGKSIVGMGMGVKKLPQPKPASIPTTSAASTTSTTSTNTEANPPTPSTHPDKLVELKTRVVQLLALRSMEAGEIVSKLDAHPQDIQYLLSQVAYSQKTMQTSTPLFHLKHELWNDVRVDDWSEYSDSEKQQVAAAVRRKTGKISQCIASTVAPSKDKERDKEKDKDGKKAAPAKTRQNLLRASQGKKVSRSPSPANSKAMLNSKDASSSGKDKEKDKEKGKDVDKEKDKGKEKDKEKDKDKDKDKEKEKDTQSSNGSRSPSVLSAHSSSAASKDSAKRKRQDEAAEAAKNVTATQTKTTTSKRMKKDESATRSKQRSKIDYTSSEDSATPPPPKPKMKGVDKRLNNDENYKQLYQQYLSAMNTLQTQHALYKGEYEGTHDLPTMLLGEGAIQALVIGVNEMHKQLNEIRRKDMQRNGE